jgi:sterol 3beta-glucosyltransferase
MNILILTVGSRGDVQPYVALGMGLRQAGYQVTLATVKDFRDFVTARGLNFAPLNSDFLKIVDTPEGKAAMAGKTSLALIKQVMPMLRQMMEDAWDAAQGAEAVIYHPKAMAGYHIAEKLGIPGFLSIPSPLYSPTRAFPNPVLPIPNFSGWLNRASYGLFQSASTLPYKKLVNSWRKERLGLPPVKDELVLRGRPVLRLYPYSPHVVPIPADWDANTHATGYWFLEAEATWQPPADLLQFLDSGPAPVYVGFGSMAAEDARRTTGMVIDALRLAGQRGVLASGWGGLSKADVPGSVFMLDAAPHDWLFPRMAAVVHHGGAGTTSAGLRAGRPAVITPFIGDQPFWGRRVADLGVGPAPMPFKKLTAERLADAIRQVVTDPSMRERAAALGEKIRAEDGVRCAVEVIRAGLG